MFRYYSLLALAGLFLSSMAQEDFGPQPLPAEAAQCFSDCVKPISPELAQALLQNPEDGMGLCLEDQTLVECVLPCPQSELLLDLCLMNMSANAAPGNDTVPEPEIMSGSDNGTVPEPEIMPEPGNGTVPEPEMVPPFGNGTVPEPEIMPGSDNGTEPEMPPGAPEQNTNTTNPGGVTVEPPIGGMSTTMPKEMVVDRGNDLNASPPPSDNNGQHRLAPAACSVLVVVLAFLVH